MVAYGCDFYVQPRKHAKGVVVVVVVVRGVAPPRGHFKSKSTFGTFLPGDSVTAFHPAPTLLGALAGEGYAGTVM